MTAALHLDFIKLRAEAPPPAREAVLAGAADLGCLSGVLGVRAIDAEDAAYDLVTLFLLESTAAIEPFGTDQRYARFLQGAVVPLLQRLDGADVALDGDAGPALPYAACLAIAALIETYDWEVRGRLEAWARGQASAAWTLTGLAAGDPTRFRGVAIAAGRQPFPDAASPEGGSVLVQGKLRDLT